MASSASSSPSLPHVLFLPWPAQGHITPMTYLANRVAHLAGRNRLLLTIAHSARLHFFMAKNNNNNNNNKDSEDGEHAASIRTELVSDGFPADGSHGIILTMQETVVAVRETRKGVEELIRAKMTSPNPITCIVADNHFIWAQDVADHFGIGRIEFFPCSIAVYWIGNYFPVLFSQIQGEECGVVELPGIPSMRISDVLPSFTTDPHYRFVSDIFQRGREAKMVLINSYYELESEVVDSLRAKGIPLYPVGPLIHTPDIHTSMKRISSNILTEDTKCLEWLATQNPLSVVYVSLGTMGFLTAKEIRDLAIGLEASQHPFMWVLRTDALIGGGEVMDVLPKDFLENVKERSFITSWAPQISVLQHPSVGCFLTHCGWNSTMEAIYCGVPLIGWPCFGDQYLDLHLIVEKWKIGISIGLNEAGDVDIEKAVRSLMEGEEGKEARKRVMEMKEVPKQALIDGGSSNISLDKFLEEIKTPL